MRLRWNIFIFLLMSNFYFHSQAKDVKSMLQEAQLSFDARDYFHALPVYKNILNTDKKNEKAGLNAAICISKLNYEADSAYFLIQNLSASSLVDAKYYLAKINHRQKNFDEAIATLESYSKINARKRLHNTEEINYLLDNCKNAKKFMVSPHRSVIKNIGAEINSTYPDYVPVILPDESAIYFTSRREGGFNNKKDAYGNYFEDVYVSYKENDQWKKAQNVGSPINTEANDACVGVSHDAQRMIVYRSAADHITGDLYITKVGSDNKWEPLQKMGKEVNSQFIETGACFSNDTSEIYFTSTRPGGYGGKDIYRLKKLPDGRWSAAFNLGPEVNTLYDEEAPYLHPDGITLYFSSKGHNTMGEHDVFKNIFNRETNQFGKAENLGYPINSVGNDMFFILSVDGQRAYYSSIKDETFGGNDIYVIDTRYGDNDLRIKTGIAYMDNLPGKVKITLLDNEGKLVTGIYNSNPKTGKFVLVMNPLKSYKAIVEHAGFTSLVVELEPIANEKTNNDLEFKLDKKAN